MISRSHSEAGVTRISTTSQSCWLTPVQSILLASIHGDRYCCNTLNGARHMAPQGVQDNRKGSMGVPQGLYWKANNMACGSTYIYVFYKLGN